MKELQQQKKILEDMGYNVAYICVYGSQNYGMAIDNTEYKSDIDMKAVIIPTLDDLINETKPLSTSIDTEWWLCDLKDIRQYTETLCKANPVYIESLYTNFYISTPVFDDIRALRRELVDSMSHLFIRGAFGQMMQKREALCHPYPSIKDKVDKYGYDPKQLHHIRRFWELIYSFIPWKQEPQFMVDEEIREELIALKTKPIPLDEAVKMADEYVEISKIMIDNWKFPEDFSIKKKILEISRKIIKDSIVQKPFNKKEYQKSYYLRVTKPKRQWTTKKKSENSLPKENVNSGTSTKT